ncbi:MAG: DUF2807 domain-containing protein [Bacteroidales bacterium]|nr:DUF2807 domain-containing protein [Bacteroidales bacterium]
MKRILSILVLSLALAAGSAMTATAVSPSSDSQALSPEEAGQQTAKVLTKDFDFKDFHGLAAGSMFQVSLVRDDHYAVTVKYSDYLEKYLKVYVTGDVLHIELENLPASIQRARKYQESGVLRATVHMPDLTSLSLSGAAKLQAEGTFKTGGNGVFRMELSGATAAKGLSVEGRRARLSLSGAAKCNPFTGHFDEADLEVSGAAKAEMEADAAAWNIHLSGAAGLKLKGERCRTLDLEASGAAKTELGISSGRLTYEGSGATVLQALEAPAAKASVELSGTAKCRIAIQESLEVQASGISECSYKAAKDADIRTISVGKMAKVQAL